MSPAPAVHGMSTLWVPGSFCELGPWMTTTPAFSVEPTVASSGVTVTEAWRTRSAYGAPGQQVPSGVSGKPTDVASQVTGDVKLSVQDTFLEVSNVPLISGRVLSTCQTTWRLPAPLVATDGVTGTVWPWRISPSS